MAFVSLRDLARSPMTVELYVNLENKFCVRLTDEYGVYKYFVVKNEDGNFGADLHCPID